MSGITSCHQPASAPSDLLAVLEHLGHPRALVLGDLILDRYTWGNAERVSQEAPVVVLRADEREARLGGAANVCHMLHGLESQVTCAGIVGGDSDGSTVLSMLARVRVNVDCVLHDLSRPTTSKERFIGRAQGRHQHQMLRVDREVRDPLSPELEQTLRSAVLAKIPEHDVVLISDYDKGVCSPTLLGAVIGECRKQRVPVLVDPVRSNDYTRYRGATTMTPNRLEAELASGLRIRHPQDALAAGAKLCSTLDLEFCIITLDRDGMALVYADGRGEAFPTRPRAVYDITGAGDMVLATVGIALASGVQPEHAIRLGNVTGGLEVEKVGVALVTRDEIRAEIRSSEPKQPHALPYTKVASLTSVAESVAAHRAAGRKIVFTNGCFDLLHVGHVSYLAEARAQGDVLVVGLNSDDSVRRIKGPTRPAIGENDRAAMLAALAAVDHVVIFDSATPHELLETLRPDVLVKGGTYAVSEVVGRELVEEYGGQVRVVLQVPGVSTTSLIDRLASTHRVKAPHFQPTAGISIPAPPVM